MKKLILTLAFAAAVATPAFAHANNWSAWGNSAFNARAEARAYAVPAYHSDGCFGSPGSQSFVPCFNH